MSVRFVSKYSRFRTLLNNFSHILEDSIASQIVLWRVATVAVLLSGEVQLVVVRCHCAKGGVARQRNNQEVGNGFRAMYLVCNTGRVNSRKWAGN
jgi:hypothetical protein